MAGLFCLILGSGFLAHPDYAVNPDAVAVAGVAVAVQREAGPGSFALVAEVPDALRAVALSAGGPAAAEAIEDGCPEGAERVALLDHLGRDPPQGGILWAPERMDSGGGPALEVARTIRELLGLAVPRPVAPWRHVVGVMRLDGPVDSAALLDAAFRSPWTSWVSLGEATYLAAEEGALPQGLGGEVVAPSVEIGRLRLIEGDLPEGASLLSGDRVGTRLALCPADCSDGTSWHDGRFTRQP